MTKEYKKRIDYKILISSAVIAFLIFGSGVYMGFMFSKERLSVMDADLQKITKDVQNFQLNFLFFDILGANATCPLLESTISNINNEAYDLGSKLTGYASGEDIRDYSNYQEMKNDYARTLVSYWLLAEKMKGSCNLGKSTILYMFSDECPECDNQGFVLTYLKDKYKENVLIFAVDGQLDEPALKTLKNFYNITSYPSLVIDGKLYDEFVSKDMLEETVCGIIEC